MERLTLEELNNFAIAAGPIREGKTLIAKALTELKEYKKIEEELGIDLITIFKGLKNGIYVPCYQDMCQCLLTEKSFYIEDGIYAKFSDYGKTWALTKEELK